MLAVKSTLRKRAGNEVQPFGSVDSCREVALLSTMCGSSCGAVEPQLRDDLLSPLNFGSSSLSFQKELRVKRKSRLKHYFVCYSLRLQNQAPVNDSNLYQRSRTSCTVQQITVCLHFSAEINEDVLILSAQCINSTA